MAIVGLAAAVVAVAGSPPGAQAAPPVVVEMSNFRYCVASDADCFAQHQAYVSDPNTGEPLAPVYNPVAVIDVHAGDKVKFRYEDGPAGAENPLTCDSFNGGPLGNDFGVDQLRCLGHEVVIAAASPSGAQEHVGFIAREQLGETFTWTVPDVADGTMIPFFCNVGNGFHHRVGMTGVMRVVA